MPRKELIDEKPPRVLVLVACWVIPASLSVVRTLIRLSRTPNLSGVNYFSLRIAFVEEWSSADIQKLGGVEAYMRPTSQLVSGTPGRSAVASSSSYF